jgi:hypothetical protein
MVLVLPLQSDRFVLAQDARGFDRRDKRALGPEGLWEAPLASHPYYFFIISLLFPYYVRIISLLIPYCFPMNSL